MKLDRRHVMASGCAALATGATAFAQSVASESSSDPGRAISRPDYSIRIGTSLVELGQNATISTRTYNGQFPGPLLRLKEGRRVTVDIHNQTDVAEQLHWHGQFLPTDVDGAAEEGTPFIPAHGVRRISFTPGPSGFRFYHTHLAARTDLSLGLYNGQVGLVYIEPNHDAGSYDREVFLTLKEFAPFLTRTEMPSDFLAPTNVVPALQAEALASLDASLKRGLPQAYEVGYNFFAINGRMLGEGEPIRVRTAQRVLFHVLNASATEVRSLALPGHSFRVTALDGNPVPIQAVIPVLWMGPGERITAIVEMQHPGTWILGDLDDGARTRGMGIVIEYAGGKGPPQWRKPAPFRWDYRRFAVPGKVAMPPDETISLTFGVRNAAAHGFDQFTINGRSFSMEKKEPRFALARGRRYRLRMRNATDDVHPLHLHRHSFELTSIAGMPTAGVIKDVVMIGGFQEVTVDFTANQAGLSLFHCHMQHHMDFGFMALFDCR